MHSDRPTVAEVHLSHLAHNAQQLTDLNGSAFFSPMVKADAYGHGAIEVTRTLISAGVRSVGVATLSEAMQLRNQFDKQELQILVYSSFPVSTLRACAEHHLTPVLGRLADLQALMQEKLQMPSGVQLIFNTGMNRLDIDVSDLQKVKALLQNQKQFALSGVCTHLQTSEDIGLPHSRSLQQLQSFEAVKAELSGFTDQFHAYNSMALLGITKLKGHNDYNNFLTYGSRPGIALYGGVSDLGEVCKLKPVMRLTTKVVQTHKLKMGESLSYTETWRAKVPSLIGVLPIGYADGLRRQLSNHFDVFVGDTRAPLVGQICMDFCMVDLTHVPSPEQGKVVEIFGNLDGQKQSVTEVAKQLQTISYEILTSIGKRVPRVYNQTS